MAFAQFSKANEGLEWAKELALKTFDNIEKRKIRVTQREFTISTILELAHFNL